MHETETLASSRCWLPGKWIGASRRRCWWETKARDCRVEVEHSADARIRIPMASGVESLNAAAAAAVLFYEAARQRNIACARRNIQEP